MRTLLSTDVLDRNCKYHLFNGCDIRVRQYFLIYLNFKVYMKSNIIYGNNIVHLACTFKFADDITNHSFLLHNRDSDPVL